MKTEPVCIEILAEKIHGTGEENMIHLYYVVFLETRLKPIFPSFLRLRLDRFYRILEIVPFPNKSKKQVI